MNDKDRNISSPHYGIYPFDPEARSNRIDVKQDHVQKAASLEKEEKAGTEKAIYEDLNGNKVILDPQIPYNHKWFRGELFTGPLGSETSTYKDRPASRVRVSMAGKEINPIKHNGIASVYGIITAVIDPKDRRFIREYGWYRMEDLSKSSKSKKRRRKI